MNNIPDYTDHYKERMEAAARTREAFQNKMQPTIHVQLQVRKIVADGYNDAKRGAFNTVMGNVGLEEMLHGLLGVEVSEWQMKFYNHARVAKEVDGTYTVTLP